MIGYGEESVLSGIILHTFLHKKFEWDDEDEEGDDDEDDKNDGDNDEKEEEDGIHLRRLS